MSEKQVIRFLSKFTITPEVGCWEWRGDRGPRYGQFSIHPRSLMAHRLSYELFRGPIPDGLQIDHLCRNGFCIRPDHMEPVTGQENIRRSDGPAGLNAKKTHCIRGHEFTPINTRLTHKGRQCIICDRIRARRWYEETGRDRERLRRSKEKASSS